MNRAIQGIVQSGRMGMVVAAALMSGQASAVTCSLDIVRAYQEALKRGWNFECQAQRPSDVAGVTFDGSKRVGCYGKSDLTAGSHVYHARFFQGRLSGGTQLFGGWSVESYQVAGGGYTKESGGGAFVAFSWSSPLPNTHTRRFLSQIKLRKATSNCDKVYDEAFG